MYKCVIILIFFIMSQSMGQKKEDPIIYGIGEWARCGDFEFKVNEFSVRVFKDNQIWYAVSGENLSDEEFLRREGKNRSHKYVVVDLTVRGFFTEPRTFSFLSGVSLYSTTGSTSFVEGCYEWDVIWKILNGDKSYQVDVTRHTSARRLLPFPAGSSGIYRLDLEGTIAGKGKAFIELGYESEREEIAEEEMEQENIDWNYWREYEFRKWKKLEDIAVRINRVYLDSLIDPIPPPAPPGKETRRYYLIVDISFRSLKGMKTIYPSSDFCIKGSNRKRPMFVADYEGRDVNGNIKLGMYERLNPGKLKYKVDPYFGYPIDPYAPPSDEITITPARETVVSRKLPFAVGVNEVFGLGRRIIPYLTGAIFLCYGRGSIPLTNLDWQERYYEPSKCGYNEDELKIMILKYVNERHPTTNLRKEEIQCEFKDLDGDGVDEVFVRYNNKYFWSSTGNGTMHVFRINPFTTLLSESGINYDILDTKTNGYCDIKIKSRMGSDSYAISIYRWDGRQYKQTRKYEE